MGTVKYEWYVCPVAMLRCKCGGNPRLEDSSGDRLAFAEHYRCETCGREGTLTVTAGVEQLHGCLEVSTA